MRNFIKIISTGLVASNFYYASAGKDFSDCAMQILCIDDKSSALEQYTQISSFYNKTAKIAESAAKVPLEMSFEQAKAAVCEVFKEHWSELLANYEYDNDIWLKKANSHEAYTNRGRCLCKIDHRALFDKDNPDQILKFLFDNSSMTSRYNGGVTRVYTIGEGSEVIVFGAENNFKAACILAHEFGHFMEWFFVGSGSENWSIAFEIHVAIKLLNSESSALAYVAKLMCEHIENGIKSLSESIFKKYLFKKLENYISTMDSGASYDSNFIKGILMRMWLEAQPSRHMTMSIFGIDIMDETAFFLIDRNCYTWANFEIFQFATNENKDVENIKIKINDAIDSYDGINIDNVEIYLSPIVKFFEFMSEQETVTYFPIGENIEFSKEKFMNMFNKLVTCN